MRRSIPPRSLGIPIAFFLAFPNFAALASAQDREAAWPESRAALRRVEAQAGGFWEEAFGLNWLDGVLHAAGPRFTARFDAAGIEFAPAFGAAADRAYPVSLQLESIRRGDAKVALAHDREPREDALAVRISRGAGIEERFDVRRDGVEHSFFFDEPIPGEGDLVVSLRVATELEARWRDGVLHFEKEGLGSVTIGAVSGIDAAGRTAGGSLHLEGDRLEYRLPAAFVDGASYPLVLDPILGTAFTVLQTTPNPLTEIDVAYDATNDVYLVVWQRNTAAGSTVIQAQRISGAGALFGPLIVVQAAVANELFEEPAVASIHRSNRFLVVYERTPPAADVEIRARAINASDGSVSTSMRVSSNSGIGAIHPDVGGHSGPTLTTGLVVWETTTNQIRAQIVSVALTAGAPPTPTLVNSEITIATQPGFDERRPAISKHSGSGGNDRGYLVVWEREVVGRVFIGGRVVAASGLLLTPMTTITPGTDPSELNPDCATVDGQRFLVVYESLGLPGIAYKAGTLDVPSGALTLGTEVALATANPALPTETLAYFDPVVDFAATHYLVAHGSSRRVTTPTGSSSTTTTQVRLFEVEPDCGTTGPSTLATASTTNDVFGTNGTSLSANVVCARFSGDTSTASDEGLAVWKHSIISSSGIPPQTSSSARIDAARVEAIGSGSTGVTTLGPGCGNAGTAGVNSAPVVPNPGFAYTLTGIPAGVSGVFINWNLVQPLVGCGSCQFLPFGIVIPVPFSGSAATLATPIPCDPALDNAVLAVQWIVLSIPTSPCPFLPQLGFSAAQRIRIGG